MSTNQTSATLGELIDKALPYKWWDVDLPCEDSRKGGGRYVMVLKRVQARTAADACKFAESILDKWFELDDSAQARVADHQGPLV